MCKCLVVGGSVLKVKHTSNKVFTSDSTDTTRNSCRYTNTGYGTVLCSLNTSTTSNTKTSSLKVKHGASFCHTHLNFRTCTGCKSHFNTTGSVAGSKECFGPWSIVTIHEYVFSSVYGYCFSVSGVTSHTKVKLCSFFYSTLC